MPKAENHKKRRLVNFRVSESEYNEMWQGAADAGYSTISGWLRHLIRDATGAGAVGGGPTLSALVRRIEALEARAAQ